MFDGKGDAVNFASDMEKAKFFGKEGDEPNLCGDIEKKWKSISNAQKK